MIWQKLVPLGSSHFLTGILLNCLQMRIVCRSGENISPLPVFFKFFFVSVKLFLLPEVFFAVFFSFWCFTSQFEVKQKNTIFVNPTDEVQIMDKQKKKESLCFFFLLEGKNPRLPCS